MDAVKKVRRPRAQHARGTVRWGQLRRV